MSRTVRKSLGRKRFDFRWVKRDLNVPGSGAGLCGEWVSTAPDSVSQRLM